MSTNAQSAGPPSAPRFRSPMIAAVLAFLVPGLGHLYQGRLFKATLYSVCILGTFFFGLRVADGKVVYLQTSDPEHFTYPYLCQVWTGLPALPAIGQTMVRGEDAFRQNVRVPVRFDVSGELTDGGPILGTFRGTIELSGQESEGGDSKVTGVWITGAGEYPFEGKLASLRVSPQVAPETQRRFSGNLEGTAKGANPSEIRGWLKGQFPRPIWDWYCAPLRDRPLLDSDQDTDLDAAQSALGNRFELGVVYTMIAGLLNLLAIFDALEGPAYGDEELAADEAARAKTGGGA